MPERAVVDLSRRAVLQSRQARKWPLLGLVHSVEKLLRGAQIPGARSAQQRQPASSDELRPHGTHLVSQLRCERQGRLRLPALTAHGVRPTAQRVGLRESHSGAEALEAARGLGPETGAFGRLAAEGGEARPAQGGSSQGQRMLDGPPDGVGACTRGAGPRPGPR